MIDTENNVIIWVSGRIWPLKAMPKKFNPLLLERVLLRSGEVDPDLDQLRQDRLAELQNQAQEQVDREIKSLMFTRKSAEAIQAEGALMRAELAETEAEFHQLGGQGQLEANSFGLAWSAYLCYREQYGENGRLYRRLFLERIKQLDRRPENLPPIYNRIPGIGPEPVDFETFLLYGVSTLDFEITKNQAKAKRHQETRLTITNSCSVSKSQYRYEDNGYPSACGGRFSTIVPIREQSQLEEMKQSQDISRSPLIDGQPAQRQNELPGTDFIYLGIYELDGLDPSQPAVKAILLAAVRFIVAEKDRFEKLHKIAWTGKTPREFWKDQRFQAPAQI